MKSKSFLPRIVIEPSLQLANVRKLNESELPVLAILFDLKGDPQSQLTALAQRFDLRVVALTLGSQGSWLYQRRALVQVRHAASLGAGYSGSR